MSRLLIAASVSLSMLCSGLAFAQSAMMAPGNSSDNGTNPKVNSANMPGMAATTSDAGNMGTGASSAAMGTGNTEKGDNSPVAPGITHSQGVTGANPNNPGGVPPSQ